MSTLDLCNSDKALNIAWSFHRDSLSIVFIQVPDSSVQWVDLPTSTPSSVNSLRVEIPDAYSHSNFQISIYHCDPLSLPEGTQGMAYSVVGRKSGSINGTSSVDGKTEEQLQKQFEKQLSLGSLQSAPAVYSCGPACNNHSMSSTGKLIVAIERSTFSQASLKWNSCSPLPAKWLIAVSRVADSKNQEISTPPTNYFVIDGDATSFEFPLQFTAGHRYKVTIHSLYPSSGSVAASASDPLSCFQMLGEAVVEFRAELTQDDLSYLRQAAIKYCDISRTECVWFYRDKPQQYFDDIKYNNKGIMEVYYKDNGGDQASPINGQIKGLFFFANIINSQQSLLSFFGEKRFLVPSTVLLSMAPNVYFADFYCMNGKAHYVTLVMTKSGSAADEFCRKKLLPVSLDYPGRENPFLFWDGSRLYVNNDPFFHVELLYTEDLDINALLTRHAAREMWTDCRGYSNPNGIPKDASCGKCNVPPSTAVSRYMKF